MAAGPVALTQQIASQFGVDDDAPCADAKFLAPLKRSPEFRGLRGRLAGEAPHQTADAWQDDGFHFFVFALVPTNGATNGSAPAEVPVAVFAMHPEADQPASAVVVTPLHNGEAEIRDLRDSDTVHIVPLPPAPPPATLN